MSYPHPIDPTDIFNPFFYAVPDGWPKSDQKRAYEDIIAPAGLTEHNVTEYQTIRNRGLLPKIGSITGNHDIDLAKQVASCQWVTHNMDKLVALKVKGVYWGENEPDATPEDKENADLFRKELIRRLSVATVKASNHIGNWEQTIACLASQKFHGDTTKILAYLRECADKTKAQYDHINTFFGTPSASVSRLNFNHILGKSDDEILKWLATITSKPKKKPAQQQKPTPPRKGNETRTRTPLADAINNYTTYYKTLWHNHTLDAAITIQAGPIIFSNGSFFYCGDNGSNIPLERICTTKQVETISLHLEAFDAAFLSHIAANNALIHKITNFLASKIKR